MKSYVAQVINAFRSGLGANVREVVGSISFDPSVLARPDSFGQQDEMIRQLNRWPAEIAAQFANQLALR